MSAKPKVALGPEAQIISDLKKAGALSDFGINSALRKLAPATSSVGCESHRSLLLLPSGRAPRSACAPSPRGTFTGYLSVWLVACS